MADSVVRPYLKLVGAQIRSQAQYRTSFILDLLGQTVFTVLDFLTVFVVFRITPALGGFDLSEVLLISALAITGFTIADLVVGNVERLSFYVRTGLLDAMLIRPRRILPQLLAVDFQLRRIGRVALAVTVLIVAASAGVTDWTWWRVLLVVITPLTAAVFFCAVFILTATSMFWWIDAKEFSAAFTYGGRDFTTYPITVYEGVFRRLFGYLFGFGFVSYYPALSLLGRDDPLGGPGWLGWSGLIAAAVAATAAALMWRTGIRHYKGTGS
ncbi:ABC-2 type transport system permease protein [Stackebrandtia endophytica]|uniref:ABC-2 type transport system permease protein n=1 Tax=Stackebrandtia endophytica TaxID=1496996 RepID=A0A543B2V5_9ACTN|nr:ABC-2 family transporter protein [Stackebrandtia endophytica]TQL79144.1 ABC-2 type transport system permease protein [Stackebrandtia endophytica]